MTSSFEALVPEGRRALFDAHGYSAATRVGELLFVSGQVGVDAEGRVVEDPRAQVDQAFRNLVQVLELAGAGPSEVVKLTVFAVGLEAHFETFLEVKSRYFGAPPFPALTGVEVAGLAMAGLVVEIEAVASLRS